MKKEDRVSMLAMFKSLVYAQSIEELEEKYAALIGSQIVLKYPGYGKYITNVYEQRQDWSLCYRQEMMTRGHETNNNAEAQFLVMKEGLLQRIKDYNIVSLFEKITVALEGHYIERLVSISNGSFDLHYGRRYAGKSVKTGELGFAIPSREQSKRMLEGVQSLGGKMYSVPSSSKPLISHIVDMGLGLCACHVGMNGAPCKHQYLLWLNKVSTSPNFLPYFSPAERRRFAEMATGRALALEMYEGIHDRTGNSGSILDTADAADSVNVDLDGSTHPEESDVPSSLASTSEDRSQSARQALETAFKTLEAHIDTADVSFHNGLIKFAEQTVKLNPSQLSTALFKFGKMSWSSKQKSSKMILRRAQRFKIGVQPSAVARRKSEVKSKRALPLGKSSALLPVRLTAPKRRHALAENVKKNQNHGVTHAKLMRDRIPAKCRKTTEKVRVKGER